MKYHGFRNSEVINKHIEIAVKEVSHD